MLIVYFVNSESYEAYLGCTSSLPLSGKKIPHLLVFQLLLLICLCYDLENFWLSIFVYLTYWRKFWVLWLVLVNLCCWSLRSKMFVLQLVLFLFFQGDLFIQFRSKSNCFVRLLQTYRQGLAKFSGESLWSAFIGIYTLLKNDFSIFQWIFLIYPSIAVLKYKSSRSQTFCKILVFKNTGAGVSYR